MQYDIGVVVSRFLTIAPIRDSILDPTVPIPAHRATHRPLERIAAGERAVGGAVVA